MLKTNKKIEEELEQALYIWYQTETLLDLRYEVNIMSQTFAS